MSQVSKSVRLSAVGITLLLMSSASSAQVALAPKSQRDFFAVTDTQLWRFSAKFTNKKVKKLKRTDVMSGLNGATGVVVDPDLNFAYVTNMGDDTVKKIDLDAMAIVASIPVGRDPSGLVITSGSAANARGRAPDGEFVITTNRGSNNASVINTATNEVEETIKLKKQPGPIAIDHRSRFVAVANLKSNHISVIDLDELKLSKADRSPGKLVRHLKKGVCKFSGGLDIVHFPGGTTSIYWTCQRVGFSARGGGGVQHHYEISNFADGSKDIIPIELVALQLKSVEVISIYHPRNPKETIFGCLPPFVALGGVDQSGNDVGFMDSFLNIFALLGQPLSAMTFAAPGSFGAGQVFPTRNSFGSLGTDVFSIGDEIIFADGFESGDTSAWGNCP